MKKSLAINFLKHSFVKANFKKQKLYYLINIFFRNFDKNNINIKLIVIEAEKNLKPKYKYFLKNLATKINIANTTY